MARVLDSVALIAPSADPDKKEGENFSSQYSMPQRERASPVPLISIGNTAMTGRFTLFLSRLMVSIPTTTRKRMLKGMFNMTEL